MNRTPTYHSAACPLSRLVAPLLAARLLAGLLLIATAAAEAQTFRLSSLVFNDGDTIPRGYTCDGADQSPPLQWEGAPAATQRFVLIVDDPDAPAGTWLHWALYDLPGDVRELPRNVATDETLENSAKQTRNDFAKVGYSGPCPPAGRPHRYVFKLYALDAPTGLKAGATKAHVRHAMEGHILGQTQLTGRYARLESNTNR